MLADGKARQRWLAYAALLALCNCGDPAVTSSAGEPQGECNAIETSFQNGSRAHLAECDETDYAMSPPVFGDHYPRWVAYQSYDFVVPFGFLVHNLEHGAVVFFYDCPEGCDDEVAEVARFIAALPSDSLCSSEVVRRTVLVPAPGLGARWAAAAWGHSIKAECFDAALFGAFYDEHVGQGPEDLCNQGVALTASPCE